MAFPATLSIPPEVLTNRASGSMKRAMRRGVSAGRIRDNLLGVPNHDFDLTTAAPPTEVQKLFRRTIPVGIDHGTVAVLDAKQSSARSHHLPQGHPYGWPPRGGGVRRLDHG